jgi:NitT/TauT family transport system ATP-binding protein
MKMRASIARALITEPKILLMDEPFAALDDLSRHRLNDDLLHWQQERSIATLFVTHNIAEAVFLSSRVLIMGARPGRIIHEVSIEEPYPRRPAFRESMRFVDYCRTLATALEQSTEQPQPT